MFIVGAVFGGLLTAAVSAGVKFAEVFNIFFQPVAETLVIWIVAVGLTVGTLSAFSVSGKITLRFKIALTEDYLEARKIVAGRSGSS